MNTDGTWVPDSCTLPTAEQPLRVAELNRLFAEHVTRTERLGPRRARLTLVGDDSLGDRVRDLVARESDCCTFFDFTVTVVDGTPDTTVILEVAVPTAQVTVLDALMR